MSDPRLSVFISATSDDLRSYREVVKGALLTGGVFPVVQEHFPPDHRELARYLRDLIDRSDAVACLVGCAHGAVPPGTAERSYTQIEYDVARELGKPVFVFLAREDCPPDKDVDEGQHKRALQGQHRAALLRDHKCTLFSSAGELRLAVAELVPWLPRPWGGRATLPFLYLHPPRKPDRFVGRQRELEQLASAVRRPSPCLVAVVGLGGQGKTTLVAHWLESCPRLPAAAGLWCTAYRGGFTFDAFLDEALAYLLGGPFDKREFPDAAARVRRLLRLLQERPTLLVIDGLERWLRGWCADGTDPQAARTTEQRRAADEALDDFLDQASGIANGTHVVLTTRALPAVLEGVACEVVPLREQGRLRPLEGLDDESAAELLRALGVQEERDRLVETARAYANHPLALTVLGVLATEGFGGRLDRLAPLLAFDPEQRLFELFEETRRHLPAPAVRFLQAASHFLENPPLAGLAVVLAPARPEELRKLAVMLQGWQLAEWDAARAAVRLHPLVKDYFAGLHGDPIRVHGQLARWYAVQAVPANASTLDQARPRLLAIEHALLAGEAALGVEHVFAPLTPNCTFAEWVGAFGHAATGIDLLGRLQGKAEGLDRADLLTTRATWLRQVGRLDLAWCDLDEAIALLEALPAEAGLRRLAALAGALGNRGNIHREAGRFDLSRADLDRAVFNWSLVAAWQPQTRVHLAQARMNRGNCHRDIGELGRAVADCTAGIAMFEALGPEAEPALALALANRANTFSDQAAAQADRTKRPDALPDFDRACAILDRLVAEGREDLRDQLLQVQVMRGAYLANEGEKHQEAFQELDRASARLRGLVDAGRADLEPLLALACMNWGAASRKLGLGDARQHADTSVSIYGRLVGAGRLDLRIWLAQALRHRSEILFPADPGAAAADRVQAFDLIRQLIREVDGSVRVLLLRFAVSAARALLRKEPDTAAVLMGEALTECLSAQDSPDAPEELRLTLGWALAQLQDILPALVAAGLEPSVVFRLQQSTAQQ